MRHGGSDIVVGVAREHRRRRPRLACSSASSTTGRRCSASARSTSSRCCRSRSSGGSPRRARLGREHARLQLVLPAADSLVPPAGGPELARARRLPRHRLRVERARGAGARRGGRRRAARARGRAAGRGRRSPAAAADPSTTSSTASPPDRGRARRRGRAARARRAARRRGPERLCPLEVGRRGVATLCPDDEARSTRRCVAPLPAVARGAARGRAEREQLEAEALEAEALRRSDALKTALLRAVSHDLRSPLTAILASADGARQPGLSLDADDRRGARRGDPQRGCAARPRGRAAARPLAARGRRRRAAPRALDVDELVGAGARRARTTTARVVGRRPGRAAAGRGRRRAGRGACSPT